MDTLRDLLEKEPEISTWVTPFGTWLHIAAAHGNLDIAEYLINQNVEIDTSELDGNPLFAAIYGGHFEIVKLLIENNIDISILFSGDNMKDMDAYAFAIERGQTEIAEYLMIIYIARKMEREKVFIIFDGLIMNL
ncbi:ankyrin repeat domain-containing protein [Priestia megaterium]|uniref:ankyrin repeat domain-containing protein n=1 Tax=Priestia megaterium TaxID=1404 RepID=UPI00207ACEE5|nr:ankyrin repeat domain-containing protein [Priestia megaterium]USL39665.1 ankyrin repeat domain-containing protein [Priestia megaterium]